MHKIEEIKKLSVKVMHKQEKIMHEFLPQQVRNLLEADFQICLQLQLIKKIHKSKIYKK